MARSLCLPRAPKPEIDVRQSEDALTQARREWQQAVEQAAIARRQSESGIDESPARAQSPVDLIQQLNGAGEQLQETQERISVTGTFNAATVRGLGGGSPEERTAKATEETAKNPHRILDEARQSGLALSRRGLICKWFDMQTGEFSFDTCLDLTVRDRWGASHFVDRRDS